MIVKVFILIDFMLGRLSGSGKKKSRSCSLKGGRGGRKSVKQQNCSSNLCSRLNYTNARVPDS